VKPLTVVTSSGLEHELTDVPQWRRCLRGVTSVLSAPKSNIRNIVEGPPKKAMTDRELEEYRALRATIRDRGTARVWIALVGTGLWAALTVTTAALAALPVATLLPLLVLALTFEIVYALHTGVERIGRYIQVFFEDEEASTARWEHEAMAYGRAFPGGGSDPIFAWYFCTATVFNFVPVAFASAVAIEYLFLTPIHLLFIVRILVARSRSGRQRALDLERFQKLRESRADAAAGPISGRAQP
jgi:hypothetical protein